MRRPHVFAFVFARAAGSLANLVREVLLEPGQAMLVFHRVGEETVDATIASDIADKVIDDFLDAVLAAQLMIKRLHLMLFRCDCRAERAEGEDDCDCNCYQSFTHVCIHSFSWF